MAESIVGAEPGTPDVRRAAQDADEAAHKHLKGGVSTASIVLTVMAFLAPLGATAGYVPLVIGFGNGLGAPAIFLLCGAVLGLFSFGFLALVRQVARPGAFYAYVTAGLGKRFGLASGTLTLTMYVLQSVGFQIFGGLSLSALLSSLLGADVPWLASTALMLVIVGFCAYRGIDFNVRVLGVVVVVEVAIIALFVITGLFHAATTTGLPVEPFTWDAFTSGSVAVAMLFAIAFFVGFESTAIYREEARNPARTIPRATWIVTAAIAVFYAITAYALIAVLGAGNAVATTAADPAGSFSHAFSTVLGQTLAQVVSALVVTSVLACQLAMANAITRYVYSFGVDRVFPAALGAVHTKHGSPHRAALATVALTAVVLVLVAVSGIDPNTAYAVFSGVSVFGFEALMVLVSLAVIVYFRKFRGTGERVWSVFIAPIISIVCFATLLIFSALRADLLLGAPTVLTPIVFAIMIGSFVVAIGYASWLAIRRPDTFARVGRQVS